MTDNICGYEDCTGCMACQHVCPRHAIDITTDTEGFCRPKINAENCIDCGLCSLTCPINSTPKLNEPIEIYSGWSTSDDIRKNSTSGGAFSEIARIIFDSGGVVFGCTLDETMKARHTWVESMEELSQKLRGSKYKQSIIGSSYLDAKHFLLSGRLVLFSGTPCQIAGLKNFLKDNYDNLITVDVICHSVPSPKILKDYIKYQERKFNDKLNKIRFRSKQFTWIYYGMSLSFKHSSYYGAYYDDPYIRGFLRDYFLRPSCHTCKYASTARVSDFTIGDWWGYRYKSKEDFGYRQKGVSLVFINTEKGQEIRSKIHMALRKRNITEAKKRIRDFLCHDLKTKIELISGNTIK